MNLQKSTIPYDVDTEIIFQSAPYIQYKQIQLDDNYKTYLETILISELSLRTGIKKTLLKIIQDKQSCAIIRC